MTLDYRPKIKVEPKVREYYNDFYVDNYPPSGYEIEFRRIEEAYRYAISNGMINIESAPNLIHTLNSIPRRYSPNIQEVPSQYRQTQRENLTHLETHQFQVAGIPFEIVRRANGCKITSQSFRYDLNQHLSSSHMREIRCNIAAFLGVDESGLNMKYRGVNLNANEVVYERRTLR